MFKPLKSLAAAIVAVVALAGAAASVSAAETMIQHRIAIHVDENDPARMNIVLNNAANVLRHYGDKGETATVRIVAYGPGLHMLRADTSPVADRIKSFTESLPQVSFAACGNTLAKMTKAEGKQPPLLNGAEVVASGVVELVALQEDGWAYVRP